MTLVQSFSDGSIITFEDGKFDRWCVYIKRPNQLKYPPKDLEYFNSIVEYAKVYGYEKIYKDFVRIFNITGKNVDKSVLSFIKEISKEYQRNIVVIN